MFNAKSIGSQNGHVLLTQKNACVVYDVFALVSRLKISPKSRLEATKTLSTAKMSKAITGTQSDTFVIDCTCLYKRVFKRLLMS